MSPRYRRLLSQAQRVLAEPLPHVPSPCQQVCVMHTGLGWCEGCLRSIDEIAQWSRASDEARRVVWAQLPARVQTREALPPGA